MFLYRGNVYKIVCGTLRKRDYEASDSAPVQERHQEVRAVSEHTVCAAHEGCGAAGRAGVSAVVYDGDVVS